MAGNMGLSRRRQRNGKTEKNDKTVHFPIARSGGFEETQVICYLWDLVKFMESGKASGPGEAGVEAGIQKTDEPGRLKELEKQIRSRVRVEMRRYFLRRKRRNVRMVIRTILILVFMAVLFTCVLGVDRVNGNSMYPYLNNGDWIVYSRLAGEISRDEVVVFEKNGENLVKRVAGLPGDTVEISPSGSRVVVNGEQMKESYVTLTGQEMKYEGTEEKAGDSGGVMLKVMDGQYMVLGDNRSVSIDSRDRGMGTVPEADIMGNVLLVFRINKKDT